MHTIFFLDRQLFTFINHLPHNDVLNVVALFFSGVGAAGIVWFIISAMIFFREEQKDRWSFVPLFLAFGVSFLVVEKFLKPLIARGRPELVEQGVYILGYASKNDTLSFPSGHATIAWAMAFVLAKRIPRFRWGLYLLAFFISLSRIYLGKHYPLDVIVGGFLGWAIGKASLFISSYWIRAQ